MTKTGIYCDKVIVSSPVLYDGLTYGSNEAAFQAQKCMTEGEKLPFTEYSPRKSKGMGRRVQLRPDWEAVKVGLMEEIVRAKFTQHPELTWRLIGTGDKMFVEGNHWGNTCWGVIPEPDREKTISGRSR